MQNSRYTPPADTPVVVRDEPWVVLRTECHGDTTVVHLKGTGPTNLGRHHAVLCPVDVVEPIHTSSRLRRVSRQGAMRAAGATVARALGWGHCSTATSANLEIHDWQLAPVAAVLGGATRVLLADPVGLGKTIQAGLIVSELLSRRLAERVLVLTPAALRDQWVEELTTRFGLAPTLFDHRTVNSVMRNLPVGINPWRTTPLIVSSIDLVKREEVRQAVLAAPFDALVIDEAHHLGPATDRGALVSTLARRIPWLILASGTPFSGEPDADAFLASLGSHDRAPIQIFRRSPRRATPPPRRRIVAVAPTAAEHAMLAATLDYVRTLARQHPRSGGARLVASVIARRAASSSVAVVRTLERRLALLSGTAMHDPQIALPWEDYDASDAAISDQTLGAPGLSDRASEVDWLRHLRDLACAATTSSSKVRVVRRVLRRTTEPLLVFSEYRDVVETVRDELADLTTVGCIHGGLSPRERHAVVHAFTSGRVRTLIATDAAGEGLNLQAACRLVVNLELPWMPRRVEQRIGRLDRMGQTKRVHAWHLVHRHSFEGTVIQRLERRRARQQSVLPTQPASLHSAAVEISARRFEHSRPARGAAFGLCRAAGGSSSWVLVFGTTILDARDQLVRRSVCALRLEIVQPPTASRRVSARQCRQMIDDPRVQQVVHRELTRHCLSTQIETTAFASRLDERVRACRTAVDRDVRLVLSQGSLFDVAEAPPTDTANSVWKASLERLHARTEALRDLRLTAPRLLAAWQERTR